MKTLNYYCKYLLLFTIVFVNSACADNDSSKLKSIIANSESKKSLPSDRAVMRKILGWPDSCEETFNFPTSGLKFFKQSNELYIAQVICTYGSYQGMSLFYKLDLSKEKVTTQQLKFTVYNQDKKPTIESSIWGNVLTSSTFDKFTILNLYSGYGHCGSLTEYDLSGEQPKTTQLKMQPNCDTQNKVREPEKWHVEKLGSDHLKSR